MIVNNVDNYEYLLCYFNCVIYLLIEWQTGSLKDRENYSRICLAMVWVERRKSVLGLSFNFWNFQGFKELFFVLYYNIPQWVRLLFLNRWMYKVSDLDQCRELIGLVALRDFDDASQIIYIHVVHLNVTNCFRSSKLGF